MVFACYLLSLHLPSPHMKAGSLWKGSRLYYYFDGFGQHKNHPSIFFRLFGAGSKGQQPERRGPGFFLPRHFLQLLPGQQSNSSYSSVSWVFLGASPHPTHTPRPPYYAHSNMNTWYIHADNARKDDLYLYIPCIKIKPGAYMKDRTELQHFEDNNQFGLNFWHVRINSGRFTSSEIHECPASSSFPTTLDNVMHNIEFQPVCELEPVLTLKNTTRARSLQPKALNTKTLGQEARWRSKEILYQ